MRLSKWRRRNSNRAKFIRGAQRKTDAPNTNIPRQKQHIYCESRKTLALSARKFSHMPKTPDKNRSENASIIRAPCLYRAWRTLIAHRANNHTEFPRNARKNDQRTKKWKTRDKIFNFRTKKREHFRARKLSDFPAGSRWILKPTSGILDNRIANSQKTHRECARQVFGARERTLFAKRANI